MFARTSWRRSGRRRRYAPRNGTMLGSLGAPQSTARRSDHAPAQVTTAVARVAPRACATETEPPFGSSALTAQPVETFPPLVLRSAAKLAATAPKSTTPVAG